MISLGFGKYPPIEISENKRKYAFYKNDAYFRKNNNSKNQYEINEYTKILITFFITFFSQK